MSRFFSQETIAASFNVVDALKREPLLGMSLVTGPRGRRFTDFVESGLPVKVPLPGYSFDVLIDDRPLGDTLVRLGFGRRWIAARQSGEGLLEALEDYFSRPVPVMAEDVARWIGLTSA